MLWHALFGEWKWPGLFGVLGLIGSGYMISIMPWDACSTSAEILAWVSLALGVLFVVVTCIVAKYRWPASVPGVIYLAAAVFSAAAWFCNQGVAIDWPENVVRHEAVVGGRFAGLSKSAQIAVYVCFGDKCWFQGSGAPSHADEKVPGWAKFIPWRTGRWHAFARFGNEERQLNEGEHYDVLAVADDQGPPPRMCGKPTKCAEPKPNQDVCPPWQGTADELRTRLMDQGAVVSAVSPVHRQWDMGQRIHIKSVESAGLTLPLATGDKSPLNVCPPVTVTFEAGYLEVYYESEPCFPPKSLGLQTTFSLDRWPLDKQGNKVAVIEVKVSQVPKGGLYDNVYLRPLAQCPNAGVGH